jgi:hypothetical protein
MVMRIMRDGDAPKTRSVLSPVLSSELANAGNGLASLASYP